MSGLGLEETQRREALAELAASGRRVDNAFVEAWARERGEIAERLLSTDPEEARAALRDELDEIERELGHLEEHGEAPAEEALAGAIEIGQRLRWALWISDLLDDEINADPVALVEQELDHARLRAHELARLDDDLEARAGEIVSLVDRERVSVLQSRVDRYLRSTDAELVVRDLASALTGWLAVSEGYQLEARLLEARAPGSSASAPSGRLAAIREGSVEALGDVREARIRWLESTLHELSPRDLVEFTRQCVTEIVDVSGSYLTEGASTDPALRARLLALFRSRIDSLRSLIFPVARRVLRSKDLSRERRAVFARQLRHLKKVRRQTNASAGESIVQARIESTFGRGPSRRFENLVMVLILAFLGMVFVEWRLPRDLPWIVGMFTSDPGTIELWRSAIEPALYLFHFVDLAFCCVFQLDFFGRWYFSRFSGRYFLRHFFLESLPALPYGFLLFHLAHIEGGQAVFLVRLLRLRALARMRGLILLFVRLARVVTFLVRGVDRAVERYRHLLDRDVVLFDPNPLGESAESPSRRRALSLEARRQGFLRAFYADLPWEDRARFLPEHILRLGAEARMSAATRLPYRKAVENPRGEIHLERVIHGLLDCDVPRALGFLGREGVQSLARFLRFFDFPIIRRTPIIRRLIPAARMENPAESVATAANAIGSLLQEFLGVLRFWGDLSGITTGPQILDRVATAIVAASKRPAVRLLLFGLLFLVFYSFVHHLDLRFLTTIANGVERVLGLPFIVLGTTCLVILSAGLWMKRIAGEALGQLLRVADSQFYPLLKARKIVGLPRDLESLYGSVMRPECRLRFGDRVSREEAIAFLGEPFAGRGLFRPRSHRSSGALLEDLSEERDAIALLYRDWVDGAILHRSDDKTCAQLLGGLTLQELRTQVLAVDRRSLKKLRKLDLDQGSALNLGPYFWFRFITESVAIETAKLILEYNTRCIPLNRLSLASEGSRARLRAFLRERGVGTRIEERRRASRSNFGDALTTGSFTAFDFLGATPESDAAVERRYGPEVLDCLRRDRRGVIRDIFGTRPYHLLPRESRVFNPYVLYRRYLGGAKMLLLPLTMVFGFLKLNISGLRQIGELVDEVLGRKKVLRSQLSRIAGYDVAVRKINRMRKPLFMEALRLRAAIDVEFLGLRLPGSDEKVGTEEWLEDLRFIGALESERKPIRVLRDRAVRDLRALREFLDERGWVDGGLDELLDEIDPEGRLKRRRAEVMRGLVVAYFTDHRNLRSLVTAPREARAFALGALDEARETWGERARCWLRFGLLGFRPSVRRAGRVFREFVASDADLSELSRDRLARLRRRFHLAGERIERVWRLALVSVSQNESGDDRLASVVKSVARDYSLWTRRLVTLRTVQTLTELDIRSYREMVREIGEYEDDRVTVV